MNFLYAGILAVSIFLVWLFWYCVSLWFRARHDDVHPEVVARIFRDAEAQQRTRELTEMRPVYQPTVSDGPTTKGSLPRGDRPVIYATKKFSWAACVPLPIDLAKPAKRPPKPPKRIVRKKPVPRASSPIARRVRIARVSAKRGQVIKADSAWSAKVMRRDNRTCQLCGYPATDSHHVHGKRAHPGLRHVVDNGIALCRLSHDMWHAFPESHKAWFVSTYPARWRRLRKAAR